MTQRIDAAQAALQAQIPDVPATAPSISAAVFDASGVIAWVGHGEPRRDGTAPTRSTVYRIASMSKSFLAAAALSLREAGSLDFDAPAVDYVPEMRGITYRGRRVEPTISMLLANRGGFAEDNRWGDRHLGATREYIGSLVAAGIPLALAPDTAYQYSNLGMSLVGRAIETVCDAPVEEVVRQRILDPLGLTSTVYDHHLLAPETDIAIGRRTFDGGATWVDEPFLQPGALGCIGGLFSTVDDVATWASFLASAFGDQPRRHDVLSAASRLQMQRPHTVITSADRDIAGENLDGAGYGYGLVIEQHRRFGRVVAHSGGLPGFSSHMRWHAETGVGTVVFANSDAISTGTYSTALLLDVLDRLDAPAATVGLWQASIEAAALVDEIIRGRQGFVAVDPRGAVFAANVFADIPADIRTARLHVLVDAIGGLADHPAPFGERITSSPTAAILRWQIPGHCGALFCEVRMIGLATPLVQSVSIDLADASGLHAVHAAAGVGDHIRPSGQTHAQE